MSTVTFEQVVDRIRATVPVNVPELTPATTIEELALDSMLIVEMVVDLQEEFEVLLTQAQLGTISTLGQLVEAFQSLAPGVSAAGAPTEPDRTGA